MKIRRIDQSSGRELPQACNSPTQPTGMRAPASSPLERQRGKIGWLLLWLVGIPVPVLIGLFLLRGCT